MSFALLPSNDKPDIAYNLKLSEDLLSKFIKSSSCKLIVKNNQSFFKFTNKDGSSFTYDTNFSSESSISRIYMSENPIPSQTSSAKNYHIEGVDVINDGMDLINDDRNKSYTMIADLTERISIFGSGIKRSKSGSENVLSSTTVSLTNSRSNSSTSNSGSSTSNNISSNSSSPDIPNQSPTPPPQQMKSAPKKQILVAVSNLNIKMSPENRIIHLMALGPNSIPLIQKRCKINNYDLVESVVNKFGIPISDELECYKEDDYPTYSNLPPTFNIGRNIDQPSNDVFYILKDSTYQYLRIWTWKYSPSEKEKILKNMEKSFNRLKIPESDPLRNLLIDPKILKENQIKEQEFRELERQKQHELKKQDMLKKQSQFLEYTSKGNDNKSPKNATPRSPLVNSSSSSSSAKKASTSSPGLVSISGSRPPPSTSYSKSASVSILGDTTSSHKSLFSSPLNNSKELQASAQIISKKRSLDENSRSVSNSKRKKRSKSELKQMICRFKEKYTTYKELHYEINNLRDNPSSSDVNLIKKWVYLHNELAEIREILWSEQQPLSSDDDENDENQEDSLKNNENDPSSSTSYSTKNYTFNNNSNSKNNNINSHFNGNNNHNYRQSSSNNIINGNNRISSSSTPPPKSLGFSPKTSTYYNNNNSTLGSSSFSSSSNNNNGSNPHVPSLPLKPMISGIRSAPSDNSGGYHGDDSYRTNNNSNSINRNGAGFTRKGVAYNSSSGSSAGRSFGSGSGSNGNHHGHGHDSKRMRMSSLFK